MGQYLTASDVRTRFAEPLAELADEFAQLCKRWEKASQSGEIARPDLLLNDVLPQAAVGRLRKLLRETAGKLEDATAGVYRYRKIEGNAATRKKRQRPR